MVDREAECGANASKRHGEKLANVMMNCDKRREDWKRDKERQIEEKIDAEGKVELESRN